MMYFASSDILNNDVVVAARCDLRHMEKAKGSGQAAGGSRLSVFTLFPQSRSSPGALQDRHSPGARVESCRRIVPFLHRWTIESLVLAVCNCFWGEDLGT